MLVLSFDQVRALLPQAHPMILVDVVEELEPGESIVCRKNITGSEWVFPGHFPERALFPGVLLIEGMAQASILLFKTSRTALADSNPTFLLAGVKVRFLGPVVPGDQVNYRCQAVKLVSTGGIIEASAAVDGNVVAKAELTFAVRPSGGAV